MALPCKGLGELHSMSNITPSFPRGLWDWVTISWRDLAQGWHMGLDEMDECRIFKHWRSPKASGVLGLFLQARFLAGKITAQLKPVRRGVSPNKKSTGGVANTGKCPTHKTQTTLRQEKRFTKLSGLNRAWGTGCRRMPLALEYVQCPGHMTIRSWSYVCAPIQHALAAPSMAPYGTDQHTSAIL